MQQVESQDNQMENLDMKYCSLCEKMIEASKFRIHEVMCSRMNYRCPKCNMLVLKAEKAQHDEDVCGKPSETSPTTIPIAENKIEQANINNLGASSLIEEEKLDLSKKVQPNPIDAEAQNFMTDEEIVEANRKEIERIQ